MSPYAAADVAQRAPARILRFTHRVLAVCLDIGSVWSIDHAPGELWTDAASCRLLAFGTAAVLRRLQNCAHLHSAEVEFLVVVDGDEFVSAWGSVWLSGSLARWAWRLTAASEAFYDESRWAPGNGDGGAVVRVRRKAFLVYEGNGYTGA
jgi:transposase InsO family protein